MHNHGGVYIERIRAVERLRMDGMLIKTMATNEIFLSSENFDY